MSMFDLRMFAIHGWKVFVHSSVIFHFIITDGLEMLTWMMLRNSSKSFTL
jgi:hypothetical protein